MSEESASEELQNRLLGRLAFVSSPQAIHASLVLDLKAKSILSAHNIEDPPATAVQVKKLWEVSQELTGHQEVLRINGKKQYVLVGDDQYLLWAVLTIPTMQVS